MIKKTKKVIILTMMMVIGSITLFAQESNTSTATFGEIWNDVDYFLHTSYWKDVNPSGVFAFTRLGRRTPYGHLELGAAVKPGPLYLGLYYNGTVVGQRNALSESGTFTIGPDDETINYSAMNKTNPDATYGVLVGTGNLGIKFTYKDQLAITSATPGAGTTTYSEEWKGNAIPAIEVGGLGTLQALRLTVDIAFDRTVSVANGGNSATFSSQTTAPIITVGGMDLPTMDGLIAAEGNYLEPAIYLRAGLGAITLENDFALRIYGTPATNIDGKGEIQFGVGSVFTTYDPAVSANSSRYAIWDNRFYVLDTVTPSYNISGESGKLKYSATAGLPVNIGFATHNLNAKMEGSTEIELVDFNKGAEFSLGVAPWLNAGVQFKPVDLLSVQAGIQLNLFDWAMTASSTTKVDVPTGNEAVMLSGLAGAGYMVSSDTSRVESTFGYPALSFALGFTFSFKEKAALDFLFIKSTNPTIPGAIYQAVGDGLGLDETSVVLSIKL